MKNTPKFRPFQILGKEEILLTQDNEGIELGEIVDVDIDLYKRFFNLWCHRVDNLIQIDKEVYGGVNSWRSDDLIKYRGFTYTEYIDLFNDHITADDYLIYPVFQQLNKSGIKTERQRGNFTSHYNQTDDDYIRILQDSGAGKILPYFFGSRLPYRLPVRMMEAHTYIVAPTRRGKSTLIQHLIYGLQYHYPRASIILIDPHGNLAKSIYSSTLNTHHERVVFCDIDFKKGYTYTINLLDTPDREERTLRFASENIVGAFNEVIDTPFSDVQKNILQKCVDFLLDKGNGTMEMFLDLLKLEPTILEEAQAYSSFFGNEFLKGRAGNTREAILARFQYILENRGMRLLLTGTSTVDLKQHINSGKVIIFNLNGLPDDVSRPVFGKMLLAYIKNICMERENKNLPPAYLFIDECQVFVTNAYEKLLSQMSKFGVRMVLAHQYVEQLENDTVVHAIKQNTAIKIGAGRTVSGMSKVIKVPPRFIENTEDVSSGIKLKEYEFLVDVWERNMIKVKAPSFLLGSSKYYLNPEQQAELDAYQLATYYKVIGEDKPRTPLPVYKQPSEDGQRGERVRKDNKPPFDLHLGDNDDSTTEWEAGSRPQGFRNL